MPFLIHLRGEMIAFGVQPCATVPIRPPVPGPHAIDAKQNIGIVRDEFITTYTDQRPYRHTALVTWHNSLHFYASLANWQRILPYFLQSASRSQNVLPFAVDLMSQSFGKRPRKGPGICLRRQYTRNR